MFRISLRPQPGLLRILAHLSALVPLILISWRIWYEGWPFDPVATFTTVTGDAALQLLIASLAVTPLVRFGFPKVLIATRRPLGLYAFSYALAHLLVYMWVDYNWNWQLMSQNLLTKRYLIVGLSAFICMLPLALTSTKNMQKRLGIWWKRIHRFNYVIAILAVIHFLWLVKSDIREPLIYAIILIILLGLRIYWVVRQKSQ
ncbi:MAG: sulfite oxidase heme-binding subunit YedZ [Roseiflexaceae bacterium]